MVVSRGALAVFTPSVVSRPKKKYLDTHVFVLITSWHPYEKFSVRLKLKISPVSSRLFSHTVETSTNPCRLLWLYLEREVCLWLYIHFPEKKKKLTRSATRHWLASATPFVSRLSVAARQDCEILSAKLSTLGPRVCSTGMRPRQATPFDDQPRNSFKQAVGRREQDRGGGG